MANLTGKPAAAPHATSVVATTPTPIQVGTRMPDAAGNEYVYCRYGAGIYAEEPVSIGSDYTASKIGITGRGPLGVACSGGTSVNYGWVQVYGRAFVQIIGASAGVSPSDDAHGPTTLGTSVVHRFALPTTATTISGGPEALRTVSAQTSTTNGYFIRGMIVATDASVSNEVSVVTADTSHTGSHVAVFLNYPEIVFTNYGGA